MTTFDYDDLRKMYDEFTSNPMNIAMSNACQNVDIKLLVRNNHVIDNLNHTFSNPLENDPKTADQNSTGFCWIYAGVNIYRRELINRLSLPRDFAISINHISFWDKMEKANNFMDLIIQNKDLKIDTTTIKNLLWSPMPDGGHWETFVNLVQKYGMIPNSVKKCRYQTKNTSSVNNLIKYKLREFASEIMSPNNFSPTKDTKQIHKIKNKYVGYIFQILCMTFGKPLFPDEQFDWQYMDKDKHKRIIENLTPLSFVKDVIQFNPSDYYCVINDPRPRHPYNKVYVKKNNQHVNIAQYSKMLNLPINQMIGLVIKQLNGNLPIWFACDVNKYVDHHHNVMDPLVYDYSIPFNQSMFGMSKADRLDFCDSTACHAMAIVGYDVLKRSISDVKNSDKKHKKHKKHKKNDEDEGEWEDEDEEDEDEEDEEDEVIPLKKKIDCEKMIDSKKYSREIENFSSDLIRGFKVENSWGNIGSQSGFYLMTTEWFKLFCFETVIHKDYLTKEMLEIFSKTPVKLSHHDSLGHINSN